MQSETKMLGFPSYIGSIDDSRYRKLIFYDEGTTKIQFYQRAIEEGL